MMGLQDQSAFVKDLMTGDCYNRWFDKSFSTVVYPNSWNGSNTEHTGLDATVSNSKVSFKIRLLFFLISC